ncbi:MAG TPA: response regulator [Polyangiaceae bacterium]|nr:response regulator [Polyangiaceae bacterium]
MVPARGKALLVDDSATVRSVLRSMLEGDGIQVVEAQDGAEGLERLRTDPSIGLVFLDVNMPGLGGIAMLRQLRGDRDLDALPVVLLTGSSPADPLEARELGVVGCLQKPVRVDVIIRLAHKFLESVQRSP